MLSVVADVGGTNIRLSVCCNESGQLSHTRSYPCEHFVNLDMAIVHYSATLSAPISALCVGIACPVDDDLVTMTNLNWQFSKQQLKQQLQLQSLFFINDYTAISLALPFLNDSEKIKIGQGTPKKQGVTAVFGPGTGLGVSHIIYESDKWLSLDGEGGHCSFAPNSREQSDVLLLLQSQFGHVSAERLLSGQGLVNIYYSLASLAGEPVQFHEPKEVTAAALTNECPLATRSLDLFCEMMGGFAGNLALNLACTGGVYIAGGIVPRFVEFFQNSYFRTYFEEKGRFKDYLTSIPTYLITHENPGLLGASVYLRQELGFTDN